MRAPLRALTNPPNNVDPLVLNASHDDEYPMSKIGIYLRVSTKQQTIEQQEEELRLLSHVYKLDLSDSKRYEEHGKSANKPKYYSIQDRPAGKELWADIEDGIIETVVVLDIDRAWRHGISGVTEAEELTMSKDDGGLGVKLVCALGGCVPVDLTTSAGFASFWDAMGNAQVECMKTRERVTRKQKFNQKIGKAVTGKVYGWNKDKEGFIHPNFEELAVLAYFKDATEGRWGQKPNDIAKKYNREGVPTASGMVGPFPKPSQGWKGGTLERQLKSDTHLNHAQNLQSRYVKHPILGRVRIGYKETVRADKIRMIAQQASQSKIQGYFGN